MGIAKFRRFAGKLGECGHIIIDPMHPEMRSMTSYMLLQRSHGAPLSRLQAGCPGIRRLLEPVAAHLSHAAPRQSGSTAGGHDAALGWPGAAGADAVGREDA